MRGFKEAAEFIGQWIKVQKHAATVLISQSYFHYRISQMICRLSLKELVWSVAMV
jgi:5-methylcytosine-specific restriction endonuclease McrBC regulatory subunit McrC